MAKVDLFTGFLGAGKTTFIRTYAKWLRDNNVKFAVVENEFGAAGVDTAFLKNLDTEIVELAGGCICCTLKVGFAYALTTLAKDYDRIIVEPSGIFAVEDFFDVINSEEVRAVCELGSIGVIVDPFSLDNLGKEETMLFSGQLNAAGAILVSKSDLVDPQKLNAAVRQIESYILPESRSSGGADGQGIPILTKRWPDLSDSDFQMVSTAIPSKVAQDRRTDPADKVTNHQLLFNSATLYPQSKYNAEQLSDKLREMLSGACGRVVRIKGALTCEDGGYLLVNCSPGAVLIEHSDMDIQPMINVIGKDLCRKVINRILD